MSGATLPPPPAPPIVLTRSYKSRKIKGGTVIAEQVLDLETHKEKLLVPDDYRSVIGACSACGVARLHAHSFRERILRRGSPKDPRTTVTIRLFRCARRGCGAVFTVLPAFLARHLWRAWKTVREVTAEKALAPRTTRQRWLERLGSSAAQLVEILAALTATLLGSPALELSREPITRRALLEALSETGSGCEHSEFESTAAWIHRLEPGIRLL